MPAFVKAINDERHGEVARSRKAFKEPLNNPTRSAFLPEKPQIVRAGAWLVVALVFATATATAQVGDPTRPPNAAELAAWRGQPNATATQWRLQSVLISGQRRIAVINGKRAGVGQKVEGAWVRAIEPTHAIIETDTETLTLSIRRYGIEGREPE